MEYLGKRVIVKSLLSRNPDVLSFLRECTWRYHTLLVMVGLLVEHAEQNGHIVRV